MCSYRWVRLTVVWLQSAHTQERSDFKILDWINWSTSCSAASKNTWSYNCVFYCLFNRTIWLFCQWVISPDMRPQGISRWAELLTILTIVAGGHVLRFHVFIKMRLCGSEVATLSAWPGSINFGHFRLDQTLKISWNKDIKFSGFLEQGGSATHGFSGRFWMGSASHNIDMCNPDCQHVYSQRVQTFPSCLWQRNHSLHTSRRGLYRRSFPSTSSSQPRLKIRFKEYISNCAAGWHGIWGHFLFGRISDNTDISIQRTQ